MLSSSSELIVDHVHRHRQEECTVIQASSCPLTFNSKLQYDSTAGSFNDMLARSLCRSSPTPILNPSPCRFTKRPACGDLYQVFAKMQTQAQAVRHFALLVQCYAKDSSRTCSRLHIVYHDCWPSMSHLIAALKIAYTRHNVHKHAQHEYAPFVHTASWSLVDG